MALVELYERIGLCTGPGITERAVEGIEFVELKIRSQGPYQRGVFPFAVITRQAGKSNQKIGQLPVTG